MALYKDFEIGFERNEFSGDISTVEDERAVSQSIKTLILTNLYERPFQPSLGSIVNKLLFSPNDDLTRSILADTIRNTVAQFEPRAELKFVDFYEKTGPSGEFLDSNSLTMVVGFFVLNRPNLVSLTVVLKRLR